MLREVYFFHFLGLRGRKIGKSMERDNILLKDVIPGGAGDLSEY